MQGNSGSYYPPTRPPVSNGVYPAAGNGMNGVAAPQTYTGNIAAGGLAPPSAPAYGINTQQQSNVQPQPPINQMQQMKINPSMRSLPQAGPPRGPSQQGFPTAAMPPVAAGQTFGAIRPPSSMPGAPQPPTRPVPQPNGIPGAPIHNAQPQPQYPSQPVPRPGGGLPSMPGVPAQRPQGPPPPGIGQPQRPPVAPLGNVPAPRPGMVAPVPPTLMGQTALSMRPPPPLTSASGPLPPPAVATTSTMQAPSFGQPGAAPQSPQGSRISLQVASPSPVKQPVSNTIRLVNKYPGGGSNIPGSVSTMAPPPHQQQQQQYPAVPVGYNNAQPLSGAVPPSPHAYGAAGAMPPPPTQFGGPAPPPLSPHAMQSADPPGINTSAPPSMSGGGFQPPSFAGRSNDNRYGGAPASAPVPQSMPGTTMSTSGSGGSGGRTIDPGQMPRPSGSTLPTQVFETRRENTHNTPPPSDVPIVVRDTGSAGPRHIRSSLNSIPQGSDLLKSSSLPFVMIINPLAVQESGDSPIPIVDPGPTGPLRCSNCKAYVCPYMKWTSGGRQMTCCFCNSTTDVPAEHFSHVDLDGMRRDRLERPELSHGSVEFVVSGEYQVRPPAPPTFFFLIDATAAAVTSGATASVCASLAQILPELPGGDLTRVGIATFDSRVHFYALNRRNGGSAQMQVLADVAEPFSPLGDASVVNAKENKEALVNLLESIPKMFAGTQSGESAAGAALAAGVAALQAGVGGRLVAFISSLPHRGALSLRPREAGRPPSERDALEVMNIEGKEYTALATTAAEHQISVDVFALTQGYIDLATISSLCTTTTGSLQRYNPFNPAADSARFHNDLRWSLVRPQGLEAVARLRTSRGLAVDNYVGAFYRRNSTDLHFPAVSCDHAIAARIVHEERLQEGSEAYFQYALLYTTTEGSRRVRLHTIAIPVSRSLGSVFRGADLEAYLAYVARKVSQQLPGRTLAACKEVVTKAAIDTLVAYRKHCATASSSGQLILPESLKLLPLYALGLTKLPCFRTDARADSRAVWMARLLSLPADRIIPALHPRMVAVHTLPTRPPNAPIIPEKLPVTAEKLDPEGIFLLENGFDAYLFVGSAVAPEVCTQLLGVPRADSLDASQFAGPPVLDNPLSRAVIALLDELRRQRRSYMHLRLVWRGHPQEAGFVASLMEDRSPSTGMSYVEYLCHLHRQIQNKLT